MEKNIEELLGILFVSLWCGVIGWKLSSLSKKWWLAGYLAGLLPVVMIGIANYIESLHFIPPFSWLTAGRNEFGFAGCCAVLMLTILTMKSERKFYKASLPVFLAAAFYSFSISPFLQPILLAEKHSQMQTVYYKNMCMQTTDYTCGPAASVTALRRLGVQAEEGDLAIACSTNSSSGTQPDLLEEGIQNLYGEKGIRAQYRLYSDVDELRGTEGFTVVVIDWWFVIKHYVTVLDVTDDKVFVADPVRGKRTYTHDEFMDDWCMQGVVVSRK